MSEIQDINCEQLLDTIWALIYGAEKEAVGKGIRKPQLRVYLSPEQRRAITIYISTLDIGKQVFIGRNGRTLFGAEVGIRTHGKTPEAIII